MSAKFIEDFSFCAMGAIGALLDMLGVVPVSQTLVIPILDIDVVEVTQKVVISVLTAGFGAGAAYIAKEVASIFWSRVKKLFRTFKNKK